MIPPGSYPAHQPRPPCLACGGTRFQPEQARIRKRPAPPRSLKRPRQRPSMEGVENDRRDEAMKVLAGDSAAAACFTAAGPAVGESCQETGSLGYYRTSAMRPVRVSPSASIRAK